MSWKLADGLLTDHWILDDSIDEHVDAWEQNTMWDSGELRDVRWLDEAGSAVVRQVFAVEPTYAR